MENKTVMEVLFERLKKEGYLVAADANLKTRYVLFAKENKIDVRIIDETTRQASIETVFTKTENYGDKLDLETFKAIYTHIRTSYPF